MNKQFIRNPWFIFSPFLFYYSYLVYKNKWPSLYGDEIRYVDFARKLLHGHYSPPLPHINLWNGPGYPMLLAPFMAFNVDAIYITLTNAVFEYLAIVFLYKALKLIANYKIAVIFSLMLAFYPNALSMLPILYTEAFATFLVSLFIYWATIGYCNGNKYAMLTAGLTLGFLTLVKIIFGYVLIIGLMATLVAMLLKKNKLYYLQTIKVLAIAFAVTIPYLVYTWQLTSKVLYWGNSGGMSLYWMSSPYPQEYGDWKVPNLSNNQYPTSFKSAEVVAILKKNHAAEIKAILKHNELEQDELFKQKALVNIKNNPVKFLTNYYYNFSRMLFNFPYSYSYQDGGIVQNILIGSFILWGMLLAMLVTFINWHSVIYPIKLALLITGIYLLLSGALSAYPRQLNIIIPVLLFWAGFLTANMQKPGLKFTVTERLEEIELTELAEVGVLADGGVK